MRSLLWGVAFAVGLAAPLLAQTQPNYVAQVMAANPDVLLTFGEASGSFMDSVGGLAFAPSSSGTILYQRPSTLEGGVAASLSYDAYLTSPNTSLGNFDWSQPWWAITDIKPNVNLANYTRVELFSKGVPNANLTVTAPGPGLGYEAFLLYNGADAVPCLNLTSSTPAGAASGISACAADALPNGYGGTIAFTYDGSGTAGGIRIYVNGIGSSDKETQAGTPMGFSMSTSAYPLYVGGDSTNYIVLLGANVHNNAPTVLQAFAMGRGTLSQATIQSLVVHDRFWAQLLPPPPATPKTVIWDDDGCQDSDNLNSLATAIRLHQLGYFQLALVNNTDWTDYGAAIFRQMLDQGGLHHVPVSSSQETWPTSNKLANEICNAANLAEYNATYLPRNQQMTDVVGYRTALAAAADGSVQIVVGGALRGIYDLMTSRPDAISSLTGAQLFAAKVMEIDMSANAGSTSGDFNLGEDPTGAAYVLTNAGVPIYFYGTYVNFGVTGPGADAARIQQYPFAATLKYANALTRGSWDTWPVLGVLDRSLFWDVGTPGTITIVNSQGGNTFTTATNSSQYLVTLTAPWANANVAGTWFVNSLINANPEPPVVP